MSFHFVGSLYTVCKFPSCGRVSVHCAVCICTLYFLLMSFVCKGLCTLCCSVHCTVCICTLYCWLCPLYTVVSVVCLWLVKASVHYCKCMFAGVFMQYSDLLH